MPKKTLSHTPYTQKDSLYMAFFYYIPLTEMKFFTGQSYSTSNRYQCI